MNYDFPDPTTLSEDQQLLWWFDEYLRHDLIFTALEYSQIILVERYDLYNYPFADNYSYYLYQLAINSRFYEIATSYLEDYIEDLSGQIITIPSSNSINEVIITYLVPDYYRPENCLYQRFYWYRRKNNLSVDDFGAIGGFLCFKKYHQKLRILDREYLLKIPDHAPYSVVISGTNNEIVNQIKELFNPHSLYENINKTIEEATNESGNKVSVNWINKLKYDYSFPFLGYKSEKQIIRYREQNSDLNIEDENNPNYWKSLVQPLTLRYISQAIYTLQVQIFEIYDFHVRITPPSLYYGDLGYRDFGGGGYGTVEEYTGLTYKSNVFKTELLDATSNSTRFEFNDLIEAKLIYANPPDSSFNGFFVNQKEQYTDYINLEIKNGNYNRGIDIVLKPPIQNIATREINYRVDLPSDSIKIYEPEQVFPNDVVVLIPNYENSLKLIEVTYSFTLKEITTLIILNYEEHIGEEYYIDVSIVNPDANYFTYSNVLNMVDNLMIQTRDIENSVENVKKILLVNNKNIPIDKDGNIVSDPSDYEFITNEDYIEEYVMGMELMIQEIHACLGASEASFFIDPDGKLKPIRGNLSRKVDLLCKNEGININLDGSYQRSQSSKFYPPGKEIPPGWYFDRVGINRGFLPDSEDYDDTVAPLSIDEQRVGIAYPVRCNLGVEDDDGLKIYKGGTILCNNKVQYLDAIYDDLAKAIDWEELGTGAITVGDKTFIYEGMLDLLQELLFLASDTNNNTEENKIATGVTQQVSKEILKALGVAVGTKTFTYNIDGQAIEEIVQGKTVKRGYVEVPYAATVSGAPTLVDFLMSILANVGTNNISNVSLKKSVIEEIKNQTP